MTQVLKQKAIQNVQDGERDREVAAQIVAELFDRNHKREGGERFAISRARNGDAHNPLYRVFCWLRLYKRIGGKRETAMHVVAALKALIEELWPAGEQCPERAFIALGDADAAEDATRERLRWNCPEAKAEYPSIIRKQAAASLNVAAIVGKA